jgi:hypothetical protein
MPRGHLRTTGTTERALAHAAHQTTAHFLPPLPRTPITMRTPCPRCGHPDGRVTRTGPHAVVRCAACLAFAYHAPRRDQLRWWGAT